jgi:hypothetical protein
MLTYEMQEQIISDCAKQLGLDAHVSRMFQGNKIGTCAMKFMDYKKDKPFKSSYLWCNTVDVCFYFDSNDKACATISARWSHDSTDLTENRIDKAVDLIKKMTTLMQEKAENIAKIGEINE